MEFKWTRICQDNFEKIKIYLCSDPILAIFDPTIPIYIYTDACLQGVGAELKQRQTDGIMKSVFYFSRKLTEKAKVAKGKKNNLH